MIGAFEAAGMSRVTGALTRSPVHARRRAIVKTALYRVFMVCITVLVAWVVTGNAGDALSIGLVTNVAKTGTYYVYERAWAHVTWGVDG